MGNLTFDRTLLTNLERSKSKEVLLTNRAGTYMASTIIGCNTRKYHGLLITPVESLGGNYVLLSSLDETLIQHGAAFNLGLHEYGNGVYSPAGHKYLREFEGQLINRTTYRLGNVILTKEWLLVSFESRILIKYTLTDSAQKVTLQFRPFLSSRNVHQLTHENGVANSNMDECANGRVNRMYDAMPPLFIQMSKKPTYHHDPHWYKNIEYAKERERGYHYSEDQLVPGWFDVEIRKGESIIVSAGVSEVRPESLKSIWNAEVKRRWLKDTMESCLKNAASQFYKREGDKCYLLSGYPWFETTAREEFMAVASCTLDINRPEYWQAIIDETAVEEVNKFLSHQPYEPKIAGMDEPDALLWMVRAIQKYAHKYSIQEAANRYGMLCSRIVEYYRKQEHPRAFLHPNSLLWIDGRWRPATWMNALDEEGHPITPRTGYVVEINALWYNALKFTSELMKCLGKNQIADLLDYRGELLKDAFVHTFWNGTYLDDYVVDDYHNREVRPNQIWAAALPYSPLDRHQQKSVVDICTKELLTPRGLRTLSPKSGMAEMDYQGNHQERNRNLHNGPVWPFTMAAYARAYMNINKRSGMSFIKRLLVGFESEMSNLTIGTLNELYDGNPPYRGHGGMSYAPSVAAIISVMDTLKHFDTQQNR